MKRLPEHPPNHDRWIISYADFVTLMFALFVAMYAISLKDRTSGKRVAESVRNAVDTGGFTKTMQRFLAERQERQTPGLPDSSHNDQSNIDPSLREPFLRLNQDLKQQIAAGAIRLHLDPRGLVISLQEKAFFPSGDDAIYSHAYQSIEQVAKNIAKLSNPIRLEGHTDSVPIHTARFKNNWELSTARSIALLQLLEERFGLDSSRFAVAGYAQTMPIASNDTEEGKARNRRVEIVILGWQDKSIDVAMRPEAKHSL
jgi:chemotaxis protein MotB